MGKLFFFVGIGGFFGSMVRYYFSILFGKMFSGTFPISTLVVNTIGCLLIGIFYGLSERSHTFSPELRLFLTTGFCGWFTTFSAFSYEGLTMINDGEWMLLAIYTGLGVVAGLLATYLGVYLIKS